MELSPLEKAVFLLRKVDQHLSERIIDPCGYDPSKESREDLLTMVIALSEENEKLLNEIRKSGLIEKHFLEKKF